MAHILVVDDHADTREIFRVIFESRGHRVSEAGDGKEGLEVTLEDLPDLVILDLRLPVLNGWDFMERLRQDPRGRDIPVLLTTADGADAVRERALQSSCDGVLVKPVSLKTLVERAERCLRKEAP
ncbi:MAG TPA: response regulator [Longimicrobiales bacterium]|nr:response regulator [Longimicrobiales bacterium]